VATTSPSSQEQFDSREAGVFRAVFAARTAFGRFGRVRKDLNHGLINRNPRPEQLELNDYVDRSRRMHRNDLENIPAFLACGLLFVAAAPSYLFANVLMYTFVGARLILTLANATKQTHEVRATLYTIGSLVVIIMALYVLAGVIF
jgi:glutathione S-transferase